MPAFKSRINTRRLEDYKWELRTSWAELERRAGLSSGWIGGMVRNQRESVHLKTVDAIANAIASIMEEQGKEVPETLWFELVEVEVPSVFNETRSLAHYSINTP